MKLIFVLLIFVTACSNSIKVKRSPSATIQKNNIIDLGRAKSGFQFRPIRVETLPNGLKIFFIEDLSLPRIKFSALIKTGAIDEVNDKQGINSFVASLLDQGTQNLTLDGYSSEMGEIAAEINIQAGSDFTLIETDSLSKDKKTLLYLFSEALLKPAFREPEIQRLKGQVLAQINQKPDHPEIVVEEAFNKWLFGSRSYGFETEGVEKTIKNLKRKDIIKQYLNYYRPNNTSLSVVGQFDEEYVSQVISVFSKWSSKKIQKKKYIYEEVSPGFQVRVLTKKGLEQTQIVLGHMGISRNDPLYLKARILNEVLGGGFVSRLNQRIRVEKGLTYAISSAFSTGLYPRPFMISTFTKNESVGETLDEIQKTVKSFVDQGMTEEELVAAKAQFLGQFPRLIDTVDKFGNVFMLLDYYGIGNTYLSDVFQEVEDLKLKDLNEAIKKLIHPENFKVVVYTDKNELGHQLDSYHPEWIP